MKLEKWALIADIVGGAAIVVTLVVLIFEVNDNTNAIQAQTYQGLMSELNEYRMILADPEGIEGRTRVLGKLAEEGWGDLTDAERLRLWAPSTIRWGIYESAYFANERGVLGQSEWTRFESAVCRGYEDEQHFWRPEDYTQLTELLTQEFVDYVEGTCGQ